jgi:ABC-type nitrate/sulfonate/bicarbonate transport system substrate-binding protein
VKVVFKKILDRVFLSFFIMLTLAAVECRALEKEREFVPIRIGWQMPAATQGQIVQVLKRTNVLDTHGLDPSLVPFSYGGPQVAAAFAGELDVVFSGDQPAINLIARGGKWKIVARLFEDNVATITPMDSPIRELKDLRGRTVASAVGSVGQRDAVLQQRAAGLDPDKDVLNKNVDILEIRNRVLGGGVEHWDGFDAAVVWDPLLSRFKLGGQARILASRPYLGVVSMSDNFIANHPEAAAQFLVALARAWEFLAHDPDSVMQWYVEDTRLDYTPEELIAARLDPNFSAAALSEIDMALKAGHIATLEQGAAWGRSVGSGDAWSSASVNQSLLVRAQQIISEEKFKDIEIVLPSSEGPSLISNEYNHLFDSVPIGMVFAFIVLIALLAIEFGLWLGKREKKHLDDPSLQPIATVVGAVLGMMAFVIALTFGSANARLLATGLRSHACRHCVCLWPARKTGVGAAAC